MIERTYVADSDADMKRLVRAAAIQYLDDKTPENLAHYQSLLLSHDSKEWAIDRILTALEILDVQNRVPEVVWGYAPSANLANGANKSEDITFKKSTGKGFLMGLHYTADFQANIPFESIMDNLTIFLTSTTSTTTTVYWFHHTFWDYITGGGEYKCRISHWFPRPLPFDFSHSFIFSVLNESGHQIDTQYGFYMIHYVVL